MAEQVGEHLITSAYSQPAPNDPLDATVVTGNDNNTRTFHNAHDNDATIHLQSSALGSRPAAGTLGRKWVATTTVGGTAVASLAYDTGSAWVTDTTFAVTNGQPGIYDAGNSGTSLAINWNNGPVQKVTLTGNAALTFSNPQTGSTYTLILVQDGTGGRTVTLTGFEFGDNPPSYNTGANYKNVVSGLYDGTDYLAAFAVKGA